MNTIDLIKLVAALILLGGIAARWIFPELVAAYRNIRWLKEHKADAWLQEREDFEAWRKSRTDLRGER